MVIQNNYTFIKNQNSPIVSKTYINSSSDLFIMQIDGSFDTCMVKVEGRINPKAAWVSIGGVDLGTFAAVKDGFTKAGLYEFDIIGVRELRVNVSSLTGGEITVFGQFISSEED